MGIKILDKWEPDMLTGSLRDVNCGQWLSLDPGHGYTGVAARDGVDVLDAAVIARTTEKVPTPAIDDYAAWMPYFQRVVDIAGGMTGRFDPKRPMRVVAEMMIRPKSIYRNGRRIYIPDHDWMPEIALIGALCGAFSTVHLVYPQRVGGRHQQGNDGTGDVTKYYAEPLCGRKWPANFGPCEGRREHPRSASDIAAIAELQLSVKTLDDLRAILEPRLAAA